MKNGHLLIILSGIFAAVLILIMIEGFTLPAYTYKVETGIIGTILFYIAGIVLVIAAGVIMVIRRKKKAE